MVVDKRERARVAHFLFTQMYCNIDQSSRMVEKTLVCREWLLQISQPHNKKHSALCKYEAKLFFCVVGSSFMTLTQRSTY